MLPDFRSFIPGKMLLMVRKVAVRLPSREARQPSSLISSNAPGFVRLPPSVRDEDIDWPECVFDLMPHGLDFREPCDVGDNLRGHAVVALDVGLHR